MLPMNDIAELGDGLFGGERGMAGGSVGYGRGVEVKHDGEVDLGWCDHSMLMLLMDEIVDLRDGRFGGQSIGGGRGVEVEGGVDLQRRGHCTLVPFMDEITDLEGGRFRGESGMGGWSVGHGGSVWLGREIEVKVEGWEDPRRRGHCTLVLPMDESEISGVGASAMRVTWVVGGSGMRVALRRST